MDATKRDPSAAVAALERDAWRDLVAGADPVALAAAGVTATVIEGAVVVRSRAGGPLLNRAYGVRADPAHLAAIRRHYEDAAVPLYFLEVDEAPDRAAAAAIGAGLVRYRRGQVHLAAEPVAHEPVASGALAVGLATPAELPRAAAIFCAAFDIDRALVPVFASLVGLPRWRCVVARHAGEPIGLGLLFLGADRSAYLVGAATAPGFRGLGAQRAMIAARLDLAARAGCRFVGVRTGERAEGDRQDSERNLVRAGFRAVGRSDSFAPPGIVWTHGRRGAA